MIDPKLKKDLYDYLAENEKEMIELTQRLCALATENPPGREFEPCVDFLREEMNAIGFRTKKIKVPKSYQKQQLDSETWDYPRFNLISRWKGREEKTLHFNSHYDVVPVSPDWKQDPFQPVKKGDRLYGRGTVDMKGSLAASIFSMKALKACGVKPPWNLELSFTADEEIGGECGAGYITKEKLVQPDAAIICEGGCGEEIAFGHRGVFWADFVMKGVSAHGSSPSSGVNAFEKGFILVERLMRQHVEWQKTRKTRYPLNSPEYEIPTMTLGGVSGGGSKVNTVPDSFHFTMDRRLLPEEEVDELKETLIQLIQNIKEEDSKFNADMNVMMGFNAALTDPNSKLCQVAAQAVESVLNQRAKLLLFGAFTDLHFFVHHCQCPAIGYGVAGAGLHGSQEYLHIPSLCETAQVYAEIAMGISNSKENR